MVASVVACGETGVEVDPSVARFVGTWDADSLTMTNDANPAQVANVIANGGNFVIVVEESGQYTATLTVFGNPFVEIGDLDVSGSTLTLNRDFPPPPSVAVSSFVFLADDYLVLDGPTEFDFNLDDIPEPAQVHFELSRR